MTADERRTLRAQLLIELEDAQEELAHLQVKAQGIADQLEQVASKLRWNASLDAFGEDTRGEGDTESRIPLQLQPCLDYGKLAGLVSELKAARRKVATLTARKNLLARASVLNS